MSRDNKQRVLLRAVEIVGDGERLAKMFGVGSVQMEAWTLGFLELPHEYFLKAVDICMDRDAPSLWDQPGPQVPKQ